MGPIDIHIQRLLARYTNATVREVNGSGTMISLSPVDLPPGWNKTQTAVHFFAPPGYPYAKPDCFWADDDLRLASGGTPQNTRANSMPGLGKDALWFSWHTDHWNASRDDLLTWIATIKHRFAQAV